MSRNNHSWPAVAVSRRQLLTGVGASALALALTPTLASCTGGTAPSSSKAGAASFGSNASDPTPKNAYAAFVAAFEKKSGDTVKVNTSDHNSFQEKINNYLQGSPDDAFTWFAGYRMQYFAKNGLLGDVSDVWSSASSNYSSAMKDASTADDGKQYFVPNYNYPWGFFYRKSVWQEKGYEVPTKWDAFIALCKKMQSDGLIPIQFADKDGWPAMGTFDYIDMRLNGYQFHKDLCAHNESWDQPRVQKVFDTWNELRPFQDPSALGLTWQDAAQKLANKQSGMYLLGSFITQQFTDPAVAGDIGFFEFPEIAMEGQSALEAPIDGLCLSKRGADSQAARDLLAFMATGAGQTAYWKVDPSNIMTAKDADTSAYSDFTKSLSSVIAKAGHISQFFDRDALPAMASNVVIPALQEFTKSGTINLANIESQAKQLYSQQ
ncbi:extracellular solute-binding protein [Microbacterium xylanilyticum]